MTSSQSKGDKRALPSFEEMMSVLGMPEPGLWSEADGGDEAEMRKRVAQDMENQSRIRAKRELKKTEDQCEQLRRKAELEIERLMKQAHEEAAQLKAQVEEDAVKQIESRYNEEIAVLRSTVQKATESFKNEQDALFDNMRGSITELCFQIARTILHYELDENNEAYKSIIEGAVETLKSDGNMVLHMPPVSYERLFGGKNNEYLAGLNERQIKVVKDKDIQEGDCLITGERGGVRAGIQTQTSRLREAVLQKWGEEKK